MEDAGAAAGLALGPAEQTDSCPGDGSWVAFQAFQHLYKTRPAPWPEGAREGGTGGGLPLSLRLPPPRVPPGPAPSAGRRRDAASGWVGRPRHPETLPQHRASNLLLLGPRSATPQNGESRDGDPHPTPQLLTGPDRTKQQECLAQGPTRSRRCVHVCVCASGLQDAHSVVGLEGRDLPLAGVRRG